MIQIRIAIHTMTSPKVIINAAPPILRAATVITINTSAVINRITNRIIIIRLLSIIDDAKPAPKRKSPVRLFNQTNSFLK